MKKHNGGYSLIEILVAISILAVVVVPTCTGMVMSFQMNAKANQLMQAELAVSSAVEELMAEGIDGASKTDIEAKYPVEVQILPAVSENEAYYQVTVNSTDTDAASITVKTHIRNSVAPTTPPEEGEEVPVG